MKGPVQLEDLWRNAETPQPPRNVIYLPPRVKEPESIVQITRGWKRREWLIAAAVVIGLNVLLALLPH